MNNKYNNEIKTNRLLSYWIFIYFLLYYFGIVPYNPKLLLIISIIYIIIFVIIVFLYSKKIKYFLLFITLNLLVKVIPLILIWNDKFTINDFIFSYIFIIYILCW